MKKIMVLATSICTLFCCNALSMNENKNCAKKTTLPSMALTPPGTFENFPLHWAAAEGDLAFVSTAVFTGAQDPNELDSNKRLPIDYAKANGCTAIVDVLTREAKESLYQTTGYATVTQASILQATQSNIQSATEAAEAASSSSESSQINIELAEEKCDTQDVLQPDSQNRYPLHWAAANGHYQQVMLLVYNKDENIRQNPNQRDNHGRTPLHYAAANGHHSIVTFLVYNLQKSHGGTYRLYNTSPLDHSNFTPLMYANHYGRDEVIEAFLQNNINRNIIVQREITTITQAYGLDASIVQEQFPYLTLEQIPNGQFTDSPISQNHNELRTQPMSSLGTSSSSQVTIQEPPIQLEARIVNLPSNMAVTIALTPSLVATYNQRVGPIETHETTMQNQTQNNHIPHRSRAFWHNWWCWFGCSFFCVAASAGLTLGVLSMNGNL